MSAIVHQCKCSLFVCKCAISPLYHTQWMKTHRLRGPGASQWRIDHPVLLDWARGSLPANVHRVGGGVKNLDVPDGATHHY